MPSESDITLPRPYPLPHGCHPLPLTTLNLSSDTAIDALLTNPRPISKSSSKNIFFFWGASYPTMHPYTKRILRNWVRRFSPSGWTVYCLDFVHSSPNYIGNYLPLTSETTFPAAFLNRDVGGDFGPQHVSDLVRFPLLLEYGGVYADVGVMGIGDLDKAWSMERRRELSDYLTQGQVISAVMGLKDTDGEWDRPKYVKEHVAAIHYMEGSQLINDMTGWDGHRAFYLMSLQMPKVGETESDDQKQAREIVEGCLSRSFGFKLAHGIIVKFVGETLGTLWRENEGSNDVVGTYADWLRYGMLLWGQDRAPELLKFEEIEPARVGPLLGVA